jgi:hypothetical protein
MNSAGWASSQDHSNALLKGLVQKPSISQGEKSPIRPDSLHLHSALVFRVRHRRDFILRVIVCRNEWYGGPNLIFGLALSLLQEIPERIDENIVAGRPLVFPGTAELADPAYGRSVLGGETDGSPVSIVRDVFLSRAHGSDCY